MGWKERRGRRYYYRSVRQGDRVLTEYAGAGWLGEECAFRDGVERHKRNVVAAELYLTRRKETAIDAALSDFRRQVRSVVADVLTAAGYHQHKRGEWRKQRTMSEPTQLTKSEPAADIGVLASSVIAVIVAIPGVSEKIRTTMLGEVTTLRSRLGWAEAPAHERLLIEDIAVTWLRLQLTEQLYSLNSSTEGSYKIRTVEHFERRLSFCHRRYIEAVTALARVRRLAVNVQINVGQNQVIAGGP